MTERSVFIYVLCNPDRMPRYVGKAINPEQRLKSHMNDKSSRRKAQWLRSLRARGLAPLLVVLESVPESEWEAAEARWIARFRKRGIDLHNHTAGGEGLKGADAALRAVISANQKLRWADPLRRERALAALRAPERCAKISATLTGRPKTREHVAKLPQNQPGKKLIGARLEQVRAAIKVAAQAAALANRGRPMTEAAREALKRANTGNQHTAGRSLTPSHKAKISRFQKGRAKPAVTRENMRVAALRRWERERATGSAQP
jgi:hypothetical protein